MCGIAGYFGPSANPRRAALARAADTLAHRGPDDDGVWCDDDAGVALAHRRLAIIDVSPAGHQPMTSASGRWVLVFNGEIYNHLALRARLEAPDTSAAQAAPAWRGHSDTETLLACFDRWGFERTLVELDGMFALAAWDRDSRRLYLARDRIGEKPLYCGRVGAGFGFASELKALRALPGFEAGIDRAGLVAYMQGNVVPAPLSIYAGVRKLAPGHWLALSAGQAQAGELPATQAWWSLAELARQGSSAPLRFESDAAAIDAFEAVLGQAVEERMVADVPLGAFLSGGIDSSTITALMQARSTRPVQTFAIGFHEKDMDEAGYAREVARHLGTVHRELYVGDQAARDVIPLLPRLYCEPFADPSQIPTYLLAKLAREHVAVALSGDAGDELLGGYARYFTAEQIWALRSKVPAPLRPLLAGGLRALSPRTWNQLYRAVRPLVPQRYRAALPGDRLHKGANFLAAGSFEQFYCEQMNAYWPATTVLDAPALPPPDYHHLQGLGQREQMMLDDALRYMPDDVLVKVDRAAMAVGLETRVPMLARAVVEFAWRLPAHHKVRDGKGKWLLREVLARHVPRPLFERPKMGFGVPIDRWLRGPLREWAEDLLAESRLRREGLLDPAPIRRAWAEHLSGERNWQYHLWGVLMFECWLAEQDA